MAHLRGDETGAESFGTADTQVPGEPPGGSGNLLAGCQQRTFQRFGVTDQALPLDSHDETRRSGLLEKQRAKALLKGPDAPRHRGVVHPQTARCATRGACTGNLEKETHIVPIHVTLRCAFLHIHQAFLPIPVSYTHLTLPTTPYV